VEALLDSVAKAFQEGGVFMYFITLTNAFALTLIVERAYVLLVRYRTEPSPIFEIVDRVLRRAKAEKKDIDALHTYGHTPVGKVALAAVRHPAFVPQNVVDRTFESYLEVLPQVQIRTQQLNMLANVATLLGLLGTILGLIEAFAGVAAADPAEKQALLASGIAIAMNTTAYGLMVAIPCLMSHAILSAQIQRIEANLDSLQQRVHSWADQAEKQAA